MYNPNRKKSKQREEDFSQDLSVGFEHMIKYEGTFEDNLKNGIGYCHFNNGDIFLGEFRNDNANGYGVYYKKSGEKICGIWKQNKIQKIVNWCYMFYYFFYSYLNQIIMIGLSDV